MEPALRSAGGLKRSGMGDPRGDAQMAVIEVCKSLRTSRGVVVEIIRDVSFNVDPGELVAVVGPSGAGKTTLLRMVGGLLPPSSGEIRHRGRVIEGVPDWLAFVFQDYSKSLFPWMTNSDNVGLAIQGLPKGERRRRVREALARVGLQDHERHYPWELSGGMQQRVAIARAIVSEPAVLLMDEPFASVDALTRTKLEDMVLALWEDLRFAALLVTHDITEAVYMADRVIVLSPRPSTVIADIPVDLPRPRDPVATRKLPRFAELYGVVLDLIERPGDRRPPARALAPLGVGTPPTGRGGSRAVTGGLSDRRR
jgi:NitT/TauT family transport system ATP-binding protein